jgi:diguanylate cyclase (GGDEF)-like protein
MPDLLTGLRTHRDLAAQIPSTLIRALWIDIDGLIWVNDQFGHDMGDQALVGVVSALKTTLDPVGASLFRVGGDEFLALLGDFDSTAALSLAQSSVTAVDSLAIPCRRSGRDSPHHLHINVAVLTVYPELLSRSIHQYGLGEPIRACAEDAIYQEKLRRNASAGIVVVVSLE